MVDTAFYKEQLEEQKAIVAEASAAIRAILGGAQTYSLDTGQTRQTVTKANLSTVYRIRRMAMAEIEELDAIINGNLVTRVGPGF